MSSNILPTIAVIGCGQHFKNRYFEVIEAMCSQGLARVALVIDLKSQEQVIRKFFRDHNFFIPEYIFIPEEWRNNLTTKQITKFINKKYIDSITHAVISTEPKAHKPFILWALHNNWHIFVDKPLTAFNSLDQADQLLDDYNEIMKSVRLKSLNCVMSCERRNHEGYCFLYEYIETFIKKYSAPITFIDIHFADGKWVLPSEVNMRENHPYKYGYGILLHSGYHYIDLLSQLLSLNRILFDYRTDMLDLHMLTANYSNLLHEVTQKFYQKILGSHKFDTFFSKEWKEKFKNFGEIDFLLTGRIQKKEKIFTSFTVKLLNTSVSLRNNFRSTDDPYAQNEGKIRQENVIIHIGPLCSIHIKSNPYSKVSADCQEEDFALSIINNPTLVDSRPLIQLRRVDFTESFLGKKMSMNVMSRCKQLFYFLNGKDANSSFASHKDSITLLSKIYKLIKKQTYEEYEDFCVRTIQNDQNNLHDEII